MVFFFFLHNHRPIILGSLKHRKDFLHRFPGLYGFFRMISSSIELIAGQF